MDRFTFRSALVLAVVLLLAGATTSFAQFVPGSTATFSTSAANPPVRDAGITEAVGDIISTAACAAGPVPTTLTAAADTTATATLSFTFNGPITNAATSPGATLSANGTLASTGISVTFSNFQFVTGAAGGGVGALPGSVQLGWNVSGNTLNITFRLAGGTNAGGAGATASSLTFGTAGCALPATVQVHGVRVNVSGLATGSTVQAFVTSSPSNIIFLTGFFNPITVATVSATVDTARTTIRNQFNSGSFASLSACQFTTFTSTNFPGIVRSGQGFSFRIREGFPGAFTTKAQETDKSGGEVTNGVRLTFVLTGLASQLTFAVPTVIQNAATGSQTLTLTIVPTADINGVGGTPAASGTPTVNAASGGTFTAITQSGGTAFFTYEVTQAAAAGGSPSEIVVPVDIYASSLPDVTATNTVAFRVSPVSTRTTQSSDTVSFPIVRFVDRPITGTFAFVGCVTDILYPYVTNALGFDTGIAITNAGQDHLGTSLQSGTCTVRFWDGSTTGKTPVKAVTQGPLAPGRTVAFLASDPTNGVPGFTGYVIATCNFQYAHGFAIVVNGFGSAAAPTVGTAYLGLIFGEPGGVRPALDGRLIAVEGLGQ